MTGSETMIAPAAKAPQPKDESAAPAQPDKGAVVKEETAPPIGPKADARPPS